MKKTIARKKSFISKLFSLSLSFLLIISLISPAAAVVFTNAAGITINDATTIGPANPYPSNIAVSGLTGTITDVKVTLSNINHTFPDDVDILLAGPTGANLIIVSDTGGSDDLLNATYLLDDAAGPSLADGVRNVTGTYKPTNITAGDTFPAPAPAPSVNTTFAATFNGTAPNGTWSLYMADDLGADMGVIGNGWSVTITTTGNPATTFTSGTSVLGGDGAKGRATPYASTITASGLTGAITDVNVTLTNVNHLNPDDIDILLVGPSGKRILLLSDAGGTTDAVSANLTFDDAAAAGIPDAGPMVTATVRPTNFGTGETIPDLAPLYPNSATAGGATLASVFNGTEPNGIWSLYIVDDATTSAGTVSGGWSIDITAGGTYGAKRFTSADFDGDGKSDTAVFRPSDSKWYLRNSSDYNTKAAPWGAPSDEITPGDYDGDKKTDLAIFRSSNARWYILNSATSTVDIIQWGLGTDDAAAADYDGDGKTDIAVRRGSNGNWFIRQSATTTMRVVNWGVLSDIPVPANYEGTNGADFAIYRPSNNNWYILNNAATSFRIVPWGIAGDRITPADYDGDGETDIAVFRPSNGVWYVLQSSTDSLSTLTFGQNGDLAVPGDYDGDSKADFAVWRGVWFINNSGTPTGAASLRTDDWGVTGDSPIVSSYFSLLSRQSDSFGSGGEK